MIDCLLPSLGADMERAMLVAWHVEPGDTVERGQVIAEVETEKGILEVECWHDGVIAELVAEPGPDELPVGTLLARIEPSEDAPAPEPAMAGSAEAPRSAAPSAPAHHLTPPIRHLAHQLGVDLDRVTGTGPGGEITRDDVRRTAEPSGGDENGRTHRDETGQTPRRAVEATPRARLLAGRSGVDLADVLPSRADGLVVASDVEPPGVTEPVDGAAAMRRAIGRSMARSKREIPHYYLGTHIDLHRAMEWLAAENEERSVAHRILPAVLLLKATALALVEVPELNGHFVDDAFAPSEEIHLGVAVSLRHGGLVAPAIHRADRLELAEMMECLRDLVTRARSSRLRASEMSDPTITVTNLGDRGVETAFPVIIPPQVAMVGFGKVVDSVAVVDGSPAVHPVVHATLAADHRVTDGHRGGVFLAALDRLLQEPKSL